MVNLTTLLNELSTKLHKLNNLLQEDQKGFIDLQYEVVEQGNIDKLNLKNSIDELIISLKNHPQWLIKEDIDSNTDLNILWQRVQEEMERINGLILTNQKIIEANQEHYSNMFHCLVNAVLKEEALVYNQQADVI